MLDDTVDDAGAYEVPPGRELRAGPDGVKRRCDPDVSGLAAAR